ncbi:amidohydrolase/deacetylase family metallohydrolase [Leisingera sp. ANG-Vp]|uniref:amidohydrolase/deacetylase family metallohydrolase n=1 Tax=Leisingera sp. ANG-Vp TaxID=1577896 RepID=UPI00057E26BB|nr:amidohydrolase/deacetylase family metallohydrolase [Leisingera sp. ANG-Vp]KIC20298.1 dihydroorotase [Leisingera sp. ANG-Vp]
MADYDLILRGGHLIDPGQGINGKSEVAFADGKVAEVAASISGTAERIEDVSGCLITPGLIDLHTHVYWGGTSIGIAADDYAKSSAVTTLVDTGSTGPGNFAGFQHHVISQSEARILVYLHISHAGIFAFSNRVMVGEAEEMRLMDPLTALEVAKANPETIIGIKVRLGAWTSGIHGLAPLEFAMQVAEQAGLPLMVHIDDPPPSYDEVVSRLRPGDVLTHCFRPFPNTPLTGSGDVRPAVLEARRRGVIFDIGHGMSSFSVEVARQMLANGFWPDTISSDVHTLCIEGPAFDLLTTLSKFLCLGMPLAEVIRAATQNAAAAVQRPDLGTLAPGTVGDASILRLQEGQFTFEDGDKETFEGTQKLTAAGTVLGGRIWQLT